MEQCWTDAARQELAQYLRRVRASLDASEQDPDEVVQDLRLHVEAALREAAVAQVTAADVARVTAALGFPLEEAPAGVAAAVPAKPPRQRWLIFHAVVLPVVAIATEMSLGLAREVVFDPLPTFWHCFVAALVPLGFGFCLYALRTRPTFNRTALQIACGLASGVAAYYSLMFVPLLPISLIALLVFVGFCGLAPFLALAAGWRIARRIAALPGPGGRRGAAVLAFVAGLGLLAYDDVRHFATDVAVARAMATPHDADRFELLRKIGSPTIVAYYVSGWLRGNAYAFLGRALFDRPDRQTYRTLHYRMTGAAFPSVRVPQLWRRELWRDGLVDGAQDPSLSLAESRIDGNLLRPGALAYVEWTMRFEHARTFQREARAVLQLPAGAVVSRVNLWVDGEPREAAYAGRAEVREAYERVVSRRRDPVLVTTLGLDRVEVRAFPVTRSTPMQIRLGFTVPLRAGEDARALLALPYLLERNFTLPPELRHAVWLESAGELYGGDHFRAEAAPGGRRMLRAELAAMALAGRTVALEAPTVRETLWSRASDAAAGEYFVAAPPAPRDTGDFGPVTVVLDGSAGMASRWRTAVGVLAAAPAFVTELVLARDRPLRLPFASDAQRRRALSYLAENPPRHGQDNVPALSQTWERLAAAGSGTLVWLHGVQPYALSSVASLNQLRQRRALSPLLVLVPMQEGRNAIVRALDQRTGIAGLTLHEADWADRFWHDVVKAGDPPLGVERVAAAPGGLETSDHLSRLWAVQQVRRGLLDGAGRQALVTLAQRFRIVTPVSGAVVLERREQYEEAGLEPVSPESLPKIPEPATWALLLAGLGALGVASPRRRRAAGG